DNAGNPTTENIDLATLTGIPGTGGGDRGDGTGFHGNGVNAYVYANTGNTDGVNTPHVTVLNADGTLRYSRTVGDTGDLPVSDRLDAAIAPDGRVIVVFDDSRFGIRLPAGRLFTACGDPAGPSFWISERDDATNSVAEARRPRIAWRGTQLAIIWESLNSPATASRVVSARLFTIPSAI